MKDFKDFNFAVIDVTMGAVPTMTINLNGISFNGKALDVLGSPEYVKPLLDAENKAFAIQVCKEKDGHAMKFTKNSSGAGFSSTCNTIRSALRRLMGDEWREDKRYEMEGVYFPDAKAVVFDLSAAKQMEPFRTTGQKKEKK